jgi:hypothetical protein
MAIHYNGTLSIRPNRRACGAVTAQAEAKTWHATDCAACKKTLVGMVLKGRAGDARAVILGVEGSAVRILIDRPRGHDGDWRITTTELDTNWRPWADRASARLHGDALAAISRAAEDAVDAGRYPTVEAALYAMATTLRVATGMGMSLHNLISDERK